MKKYFFSIILFLLGISNAMASNITSDGVEKTLHLSLTTQTIADVDTYLADPFANIQSEITTAITAWDAANPSDAIGTDYSQIKKIVFEGSIPFCNLDFRGIKDLFDGNNAVKLVDLSAATLDQNKLTDGMSWNTSNGKYEYKDDQEGAFQGWSSLEEAILPEGILGIGAKAFPWIGTFKTINFPNSIESIGREAFAWTNLGEQTPTELTLPTNLLRIDEAAFNGTKFTEFVFPAGFQDLYGKEIFSNYLERIFVFNSSTPPTINHIWSTTESPFQNIYNGITMYVPNGSLTDYQNAFQDYLNITISGLEHGNFQILSTPTSVNNPGFSKISVYPNPATDFVKVLGTENAQIQVFDNIGRLLMQTKETTIDLSSYLQGIYFFKVNGEAMKVLKK